MGPKPGMAKAVLAFLVFPANILFPACSPNARAKSRREMREGAQWAINRVYEQGV